MKPIIKVPVSHQVVERIITSIDGGEYKLGDKLPTENELCKRLQVGRSTIREAYSVLQTLEYIEVIHGKGVYVTKPLIDKRQQLENWFEQNKYRLVDIMEVRLAIETVALKNAIRNITKNQIEQLQQIQDAYCAAIEENNINQIAIYDEYFHAFLVNCSGNPLLISLNESIAKALRAYRINAYSIAANKLHAIGPHQEIVNSLQEGNLERVNEAISNHISISVHDMEPITFN